MTDIFALCGVGICALVSVIVLREYRSDYATPVVVILSLAVFGFIAVRASSAMEIAREAEPYTNSAYITPVLKAVGITYLTTVAAEVSRASGEAKIGEYIELAGKAEIVALSLPLFTELYRLALL